MSNEAIEKFLKETAERAWDLGLDFFVVTNGGNFRANNLSCDVDVKHAYDTYKQFHKKFTNDVTFEDLHNYAKSAKVDDNGFHLLFLDDDDDDLIYPHYYIKPTVFTNNNDWIEFYVRREKDGEIFSICDFRFYCSKDTGWNEVTVTKKDGNMPDYGSSFNVPATTKISEFNWDHINRKVNIGGILRDLLTPLKSN